MNGTGAGRRERPKSGLLLVTPAALAMIFVFLAPFITVAVYTVLHSDYSQFGASPPVTLNNFSSVLSSASAGSQIRNSLSLGAIAASVTVGLAIPTAYW